MGAGSLAPQFAVKSAGVTFYVYNEVLRSQNPVIQGYIRLLGLEDVEGCVLGNLFYISCPWVCSQKSGLG